MKTKLILLLIGLSIAFSSCKKDEAVTDQRDKYVGKWIGTQTIKFTDIGSSDSFPVTYMVTKGTGTSQIKFTDSDDASIILTANVDNTTHVYDKYTQTDNSSGTLIYMEQTGTGSISGNTITDSGNLLLQMDGYNYYGTWTQTLTKAAK